MTLGQVLQQIDADNWDLGDSEGDEFSSDDSDIDNDDSAGVQAYLTQSLAPLGPDGGGPMMIVTLMTPKLILMMRKVPPAPPKVV